VTDIDGNEYATIVIGSQRWMAENLRTATYANGDPIPNVTDSIQWFSLNTGAWVHYDNNSNYNYPYGKLYNLEALTDPRNACPTNWHVPTEAEWSTLVNYLDPDNLYSTVGRKMKSTGTQYWPAPNAEATNESGFSALPGGGRFYGGTDGSTFWTTFSNIGVGGAGWTGDSGDFRSLFSTGSGLSYGNLSSAEGFSVRCVMD
jgi:uncharacterized protein (TIGR02145 family)